MYGLILILVGILISGIAFVAFLVASIALTSELLHDDGLGGDNHG